MLYSVRISASVYEEVTNLYINETYRVLNFEMDPVTTLFALGLEVHCRHFLTLGCVFGKCMQCDSIHFWPCSTTDRELYQFDQSSM